MTVEDGPDPWLHGVTPITHPFDEQSVCDALDQESIGYEVLRGHRYERWGHISFLIAHPDPPTGISGWCILRTMEDVTMFFQGWRLCKMMRGPEPMTSTG